MTQPGSATGTSGHQHTSVAAGDGGGDATSANRPPLDDEQEQRSGSGSTSSRRGKRVSSEGGGGQQGGGRTSASVAFNGKNKDLLQRLIQSCDKHRHDVHDLDGGNREEGSRAYSHYRRPMSFASSEKVAEIERLMDETRVEGSISKGKCRKHLSSFEAVVDRLEKTLSSQLDKISVMLERLDANTAALAAANDGANATGSADGRIGAGLEDKELIETAKFASNLCFVYRLIMEGGFCPYSLYIIDWGRCGVHGRMECFVSCILHARNELAQYLIRCPCVYHFTF